MVEENDFKRVIKIGFYSSRTDTSIQDFQEAFDIVCTENDNYNDLLSLFKKIL